jgi:CheY-like chemotaxis protein
MNTLRKTENMDPKETLLSELQCGSPEQTNRGVVLLVEPEEVIQASVINFIDKLYPAYRIEKVCNSSDAVERISRNLSEDIALIVVTSSQNNGTCLAKEIEDEKIDLSRVPIVTVTDNSAEQNEKAKGLIAQGKIDGACAEPLSLVGLDYSSSDAINNRLTAFRESEATMREKVLSEFIEYAETSLLNWKANLPKARERFGECKEECDALASSLVLMEQQIEALKDLGTEISADRLSEIIHDMNNKLSVFLGYIPVFSIKSKKPNDVELLNSLLKSFQTFARYLKAIRSAYDQSNLGTWKDISSGDLEGVPETQRLEMPEGLKVCVVDDDPGVLSYCSKTIRNAGGDTFEAFDEMSLLSIHREVDSNGVDLVLLDNDLGDFKRGNDLIPLIRGLFPRALVIAHTGDAEALKKDPKNPYANHEVEVAGKHQWNEVSKIIKSHYTK